MSIDTDAHDPSASRFADTSPRGAWGGTPQEGRRLIARQRIGGAYCRPPWVHSLFRPRSILSGLPWPTLRSNISP